MVILNRSSHKGSRFEQNWIELWVICVLIPLTKNTELNIIDTSSIPILSWHQHLWKTKWGCQGDESDTQYHRLCRKHLWWWVLWKVDWCLFICGPALSLLPASNALVLRANSSRLLMKSMSTLAAKRHRHIWKRCNQTPWGVLLRYP